MSNEDICTRRCQAGLSKEQVARQLEIATRTWYRWERQNKIPKRRDRLAFERLISSAMKALAAK